MHRSNKLNKRPAETAKKAQQLSSHTERAEKEETLRAAHVREAQTRVT